jgi:hypothetical protein
VFPWASFCECRRLSPLSYEDGQMSAAKSFVLRRWSNLFDFPPS